MFVWEMGSKPVPGQLYPAGGRHAVRTFPMTTCLVVIHYGIGPDCLARVPTRVEWKRYGTVNEPAAKRVVHIGVHIGSKTTVARADDPLLSSKFPSANPPLRVERDLPH
jgi:hypothetical protein